MVMYIMMDNIVMVSHGSIIISTGTTDWCLWEHLHRKAMVFTIKLLGVS